MATAIEEDKRAKRTGPAGFTPGLDVAAPLNITPPGTMAPDKPAMPAPVATQPAPQFARTNAGPMLQPPPAPVPTAPAAPDPTQQRLANQTAMYVQGAQAAAAARPAPAPVAAGMNPAAAAQAVDPMAGQAAFVPPRLGMKPPTAAVPAAPAAPLREGDPGWRTQAVMDGAAQDAQAAWGRGEVGQTAGALVRGAATAIPAAAMDFGEQTIAPISGAAKGFWRGLTGGDSAPATSPATPSAPVASGNEGRRTPMQPVAPAATAATANGNQVSPPAGPSDQATANTAALDGMRANLNANPGLRQGLTNAQVGGINPGGRVTAVRQANGVMSFGDGGRGPVTGAVSYVDGKGDALAGGGQQGKGFGNMQTVAGGQPVALGPDGGYAATPSGPSTLATAQASGQPAQGVTQAAAQVAPAAVASGQAPVAGTVNTQANAAPVQAAGPGANQQALARLQANNAAAQPRGFAPQQQPRQFDRAASIKAMTDLTSPEYRALRALRMEAESEAKDNARLGRAGRGNNAAGQAYAALMAELTAGTRQGQIAEMQDGTTRYTTDRREEGATERALIGEEGATRRAGMTNEVQQGELGLKREAQGFASRAGQRLEAAQAAYDNAKTDEERAAAAKRIREIQGKEKPESWKGVALQGGTDAQGNKTESVLAAVNEATGEMRKFNQSVNSIDTDPRALAIKNNASLSREQKAAQLKQLGY